MLPHPATQSSVQLAGRYELGEPLRETEQGQVFLARDGERHGRACELLVLKRPVSGEVLADWRASLAELPVEALVRVLEVLIAADGRGLCALEPVEGESVADLLARRRALHPGHALEIARQILVTLEVLHPRGHCHGALAPECVLLEDRVPWSAANPFAVRVRLSEVELEAALENRKPTVEGDVVAVGRLLATCLSGLKVSRELREWDSGELERALHFASGELRGVLGGALGRGERFASARDLRLALERVPEARWKPERRRGRLVGFGILGLFALAATAFLFRERSAHAAAADEAERASALERTLGELRAENAGLARRNEELARETPAAHLERRWDELLAHPRAAQVDEVLGIARWSGDDRLGTFLSRYVDDLRALESPQGLAVERLSTFPHLSSWSARVLERADLALGSAGEIALFDHARDLADRETEPVSLPPLLRARFSNAPEGWRTELLRHADLLAGFPGAVGTRRVFLESDAATPQRWIREEVADVQAGSEEVRWAIERTVFDLDGEALSRSLQELARRGKVFAAHGADEPRTLDLAWRAGDGTWRSHAPRGLAVKPPADLGIDAQALFLFRRSLERREWDVLAVDLAPGELLLSPGLGEVARSDGRGLVRELAFADRVR